MRQSLKNTVRWDNRQFATVFLLTAIYFWLFFSIRIWKTYSLFLSISNTVHLLCDFTLHFTQCIYSVFFAYKFHPTVSRHRILPTASRQTILWIFCLWLFIYEFSVDSIIGSSNGYFKILKVVNFHIAFFMKSVKGARCFKISTDLAPAKASARKICGIQKYRQWHRHQSPALNSLKLEIIYIRLRK